MNSSATRNLGSNSDVSRQTSLCFSVHTEITLFVKFKLTLPFLSYFALIYVCAHIITIGEGVSIKK